MFLRIVVFILFILRASGVNAESSQGKLPFEIPRDYTQLPKAAQIETTKGTFRIEFFREAAPITVRNFEHLAKSSFYKNVSFHRHEPGFVIQGGDPTGTGTGGPGYLLPPEFNDKKHIRGTLGMARLPSEVNVERLSNGSQFYICLGRAAHLDGLYTAFAQVTDGMSTVDQLRRGDKILGVTLEP